MQTSMATKPFGKQSIYHTGNVTNSAQIAGSRGFPLQYPLTIVEDAD